MITNDNDIVAQSHSLKQAREVRGALNSRFIDKRKKDGLWTDHERGKGMQVTLEAMQALTTQASLFPDSAPRYPADLYLEDFDSVKNAYKTQSAFSPPEHLGRDESSAETAALVLRTLPSMRSRLRSIKKWDRKLSPDYERLVDGALDFLIETFQVEGVGASTGGWGMTKGDRPQLYFTVAAVRALKGVLAGSRISDDMRKEIKSRFDAALRFLKECIKNNRFCKSPGEEGEGQSAYSGYGLLGLEAIQDAYNNRHCPKAPTLKEDVIPIFDNFGSDLESMRDTPNYSPPGIERYEDHSSPWILLRAMALWMNQAPLFYTKSRHSRMDELAGHLREGAVEDVQCIYVWNRAMAALASYERFSNTSWTVTGYDVRKSLYQLFGEPSMAGAAFDYLSNRFREG